MQQSNHTITFLLAGRSQATITSKRDAGKWDQRPCCSKWLTTNEVAKTQQQTNSREMPKGGEVTTPEERTIPEEVANQQCAATTNEPTNQSRVKTKRGTSALKALKQKAKETKRKRNQNKKKFKKLEQIVEETESDSDDETLIQTEQNEGERQEEKPDKAKEENNAEKEESEQEQKTTPKRRKQRSRNKPNYYGQNVMVTQLSPAREREDEEANRK